MWKKLQVTKRILSSIFDAVNGTSSEIEGILTCRKLALSLMSHHLHSSILWKYINLIIYRDSDYTKMPQRGGTALVSLLSEVPKKSFF